MKKGLLALGVGALLLMTGCSQRLGEFTVASTKNVANLKTTEATADKHTEGETCIHTVIIFPFGNFQNRIQEAMDDAIENAKEKGIEGDLLLNARIYRSSWYIPFIYGQDCIKVEGDLVKVKQ